MKKYLTIVVTALVLLFLSACEETPPLPNPSIIPTTASTSPKVNCNDHDFSDDPDICSNCGLDYFSATLELELAPSRDYYILKGPGECTRTEIVVPESYYGKPIKIVADGAFKRDYYDPVRINCDKITSITLPDSITEIGENAFRDCWSLSYINIPSSLTEISPYVFLGCAVLQSVDIPVGVTVIGEGAFWGCTELKISSLPEGLEAIGDDAFCGCEALQEIVIPETVTVLGAEAFGACRALESVTLPQSIEELPSELFLNCVSLKTVEFGDNLRRIGSKAFSSCGVETLILPETVQYIELGAFAGCSKMRAIYIPSNIEEIEGNVFLNCTSLEFNMYEGVRYLGNPDEPYMVMVAAEDAARTELIVHEDTRFIVAQYEEGHSFEEDLYKSLESVYIGKSVEFIEKGVFWGSTSLVSIQVSQENPYFHDQNNCLIHTETKTLVTGCRTSIIPDDGSVTAIGNQAFYKVEGIRIMVIPDTVTEIGGNAFCACPDLESIVIGSGVQYIDHDVFIYSDKFTTVYYHGTQSQWEQIQIVGINCGNGLGDNIEIKKATIYFYSETEPTQPGNYWRYVDGVPTPWKTEET